MFVNSRLMSAIPALSLFALSALTLLPAFADCPEPAVQESSDVEYTRPISVQLPFMGKITEAPALNVPGTNSATSLSPKPVLTRSISSSSATADGDAGTARVLPASKAVDAAKAAMAASAVPSAKSATAKSLTLESAVVHAKDSRTEAKTLASKCSKSGHDFTGLADYYHHSLYGQRTSSGQILHKAKMTAAHRTLPFGTKVRVTNKRSGRSCVVVINDRGPFTPGKVIDLSHAAALELDVIRAGTAMVACTVLED